MGHWNFAAISGNITIEETVTYQFRRGIEEGKKVKIPRREKKSEENSEERGKKQLLRGIEEGKEVKIPRRGKKSEENSEERREKQLLRGMEEGKEVKIPRRDLIIFNNKIGE